MNRRSFLTRLIGAAAAVAVGPKVIELAATMAPAEQTLVWESSFIIPSQEMIDSLVMRTAWHWNEAALKNLKEGIASDWCVAPYAP